ncbi:Telo-bind domain-containing protein [Mycena chlorophos]|uniref:Telo-bind domain-containing protein n=1 Tax=Mycena chlorophos TaxID=658473 RepID=A0A8H6TNZ5_MYCCL|nr:Telo-bind domain-containing protein [Mycena chlorophos]
MAEKRRGEELQHASKRAKTDAKPHGNSVLKNKTKNATNAAAPMDVDGEPSKTAESKSTVKNRRRRDRQKRKADQLAPKPLLEKEPPTPPPSPPAPVAALIAPAAAGRLPVSALPTLPEAYRALDSLPSSGYTPFSVIGVVAAVNEIVSMGSGDLMLHLRVVDPSNCIPSAPMSKEGMGVNIFTPKYRQWLPQVKLGSVVILRNLKGKVANGSSAIGYKDQLKWCTYHGDVGTLGHGDLGQAPRSDLVNVGSEKSPRMAPFSPFYDATSEDRVYCIALDDWWREVQKVRSTGSVVEISMGRTTAPRPHCNPAQTDSEYFDWTAKVLKAKQKHDNTYTVYLTDGIEIPNGRDCQATWCPAELRRTVLRVEMWDAAREYGPKMEDGKFYRMRNLRKDTHFDGVLQAKISENKIVEVDETNPRVAEIIARIAAKTSEEPEVEVVLKTLSQLRAGALEDVVVQLLHKDESKGVIHVTDFSSNPELGSVDRPWAKGLDRCVLKITLLDKQKERLPQLTIGQFYLIKRVRFVRKARSLMEASVAGTEPLISMIGPLSTSRYGAARDEAVDRRRHLGFGAAEAKKKQTVRPNLRSSSPASVKTPASNSPASVKEPASVKKSASAKEPTSRSPASPVSSIPASVKTAQTSPDANLSALPSSDSSYHTIRALNSDGNDDEGPFFVHAKVIDFFPFQLEDAFKRLCSRCRNYLPESELECAECRAADKQQCTQIVCRLALRIQDDFGDLLDVQIADDSQILHGFTPTILLGNAGAAHSFSKKMARLLGNLEDVHTSSLNGQSLEPSGQFKTLMLERWKKKDTWVYGLQEIASDY